MACSPIADSSEAATFETAFALVRTVELEETPTDPLVGIDRVGIRPGGGFIIADERAGRVRLFDAAGRLERVLGRPGDGPGELDGPTGAVETGDGRIIVVQRADPKVTVFSGGDSLAIHRLPGQYGSWADRLGDRVVAGLGSRAERFSVLAPDGTPQTSFGRVDPSVNETPFWIFFASENAAVIQNEVAINTSLFPVIRFFSAAGDSLRTVGDPPASWVQAGVPPVDQLSEPGARERIDAWSRSFTVVHEIAAVDDSLLVVQYGRFDPVDREPYRTVPYALDVYRRDGVKLVEEIVHERPIVGGGEHVVVLAVEPPGPWTLAIYRWRGEGD